MWPLRRTLLCVPLVALGAILMGLPAIALGEEDNGTFSARFLGVNETPSISTDATASLKLKINGSGDNATITYTLRFTDLRAPVTQAHIHFAQSKVAGGVVLFLCGTPAHAGPAGTPTCVSDTNITRTVSKADIVGAASAQGIAAGDMGRVVQAIRAGAAYGNVHSDMFPSGETRGQIVSTDR